jgi:Raf kinase inhibitor-like YbhB/YbcL family protein
MDDPDAPSGLFTHWLVWDLAPNVGTLTEGHLPPDAREGRNSFGDRGYGGPRPPSGTHRYFFHAYALDCRLDLAPGASRQELERALENHVIGTAELMGRYSAMHASTR